MNGNGVHAENGNGTHEKAKGTMAVKVSACTRPSENDEALSIANADDDRRARRALALARRRGSARPNARHVRACA